MDIVEVLERREKTQQNIISLLTTLALNTPKPPPIAATKRPARHVPQGYQTNLAHAISEDINEMFPVGRLRTAAEEGVKLAFERLEREDIALVSSNDTYITGVAGELPLMSSTWAALIND